jgi:hypothetical protein
VVWAVATSAVWVVVDLGVVLEVEALEVVRNQSFSFYLKHHLFFLYSFSYSLVNGSVWLTNSFIIKKHRNRMCECSETSWCPHFLSCFQVWETVSSEDVQATWGVEWGSVARWAVAITAHFKISDQPTRFCIIA